jgi:hypothetical protein
MDKPSVDKLAVLVLGFYDRRNAGDEFYKTAFGRLLGPKTSYACMDDVHTIPQSDLLDNVDAIVCGGGDIINPYFMSKLQRLLEQTTLPCYAVSVGVPYPEHARYLDLFDHVCARSTADASLAVATLGPANVSHLPDLVFTLKFRSFSYYAKIDEKTVGVCLAQPMFANRNPDLVAQLCDALARGPPGTVYHLFAFNSNDANDVECDFEINALVCDELNRRNQSNGPRAVARRDSLLDPAEAAKLLGTMDALVCSRYHSVVLAAMLGKPFVALYCSQKVQNLLVDLRGTKTFEAIRLEVDERCLPCSIPVDELADAVSRVLASEPTPVDRESERLHRAYKTELKTIMLTKRRRRIARIERAVWPPLFDCRDAIEGAAALLAAYLGIGGSKSELSAIVASPEFAQKASSRPEDVARVLCFAITRCVGSDYAWGLAQRLHAGCSHDDLRSSLEWIRRDWESRQIVGPVLDLATGDYVPRTAARFVSFGSFDQFGDFEGAHRSGWQYVLRGLRAFDAALHRRKASFLLDAYVDRTFHWGHDALALAGMIPRRRPWVGFVHHTFDETHSAYNCVELFRKPAFLESLPSCRCLVALSESLAKRLRSSLDDAGARHVRVRALVHPTEFPKDAFTMAKFISNPRKCVVQIGAWLRDPYAIYELPLATSNNPLGLQKAALKGKDMSMYFVDGPCAVRFDDGGSAAPSSSSHDGGGCRPETISGSHISNKLALGMAAALRQQVESVRVIDTLDDRAYDTLLASNVVLIKLVDASAVNTVLECVARSTPILVNRLPALEEILGPAYPGFYKDLAHAAHLLGSQARIAAMHVYLKKLNKTKLYLHSFLLAFGSVLGELD